MKHPFKPIYNNDSKILILGSFPSVKSREINFYYGHSQNRFWKILEIIYNEKIDNNINGKIDFLLKHNIALWDVISSCDITASSDSSIKNVVPNDIARLISKSNIKTIYCNGTTSYKLFLKYFENTINIPVFYLPSSSPANARFSLNDLARIWEKAIIIPHETS